MMLLTNRSLCIEEYKIIFKKQGFKIILQPVFNKDFTIFIAVKKKSEFLNYELIEQYNRIKMNNDRKI